MAGRCGVVLFISLCMFLGGCNLKKTSDTESIVNVGIETMPKNLDPRYATDASGMRISQHLLFSSLVQLDNNLQIVPQLAQSWEIVNDSTYTFHLKKNVSFHDGKPLTAHDVAYTFEHLRDPETKSPFAGTYSIIDSITVVNDHTLTFFLKSPSASFLTSVIMAILPKHLLQTQESQKQFASTLIGSGPFMYESQNPSEIVLKKNPEYFEHEIAFEKLVFHVVTDDNTRLLKLKTEELDIIINGLPSSHVKEVESEPLNESYTVIQSPGISYNYLIMNMNDETIMKKELRQAINHAINSDEIIEHALDGQAKRAASLLSPVNWYNNSAVEPVEYNPDIAQNLLQKAGYKKYDGKTPVVTIELKTSNNEQSVNTGRIIQSQLKKAGIEVDLKSYEWGTFFGDVKKGSFQMAIMRWVGVTEPDFYYDVFHSSLIPPNGRNRGAYKNPVIDSLTALGRRVQEPEKRKVIYDTIQKIVAEELPYISLWYPNNISIVNKRIAGYKQHPTGAFLPLSSLSIKTK